MGEQNSERVNVESHEGLLLDDAVGVVGAAAPASRALVVDDEREGVPWLIEKGYASASGQDSG